MGTKNNKNPHKLTDKQMKIARVAQPRNKITEADLEILRKNKKRAVTTTSNSKTYMA